MKHSYYRVFVWASLLLIGSYPARGKNAGESVSPTSQVAARAGRAFGDGAHLEKQGKLAEAQKEFEKALALRRKDTGTTYEEELSSLKAVIRVKGKLHKHTSKEKEELAYKQAHSSIGSAHLEPDGSILLELRAEAPGGVLGEGAITILPGDKNYHSYLRHLGGLHPGQYKPVAPWLD